MDLEQRQPHSLEQLHMVTMCVGWSLCLLLHGVEMYVQGTGSRWPFESIDSKDTGAVFLSLTALSLLNAALIGAKAETWTWYENPVPWLRPLRSVLAGTPLLGLYVFPLWGWIAEAKPSWAFVEPAGTRQTGRDLFLSLPASRRWLLQTSHVFLMFLVVVNAMGIQALLALALSPDWHNSLRLQAVGFVRVTLRVAGLLATLIPIFLFHRCGRILNRGFPVALLCSLAWLAPWPFYGIAMISGFWGGEKKKKRLFTTIAYAGRSPSSRREEEVRGLDWWKVSLWSSWSRPADPARSRRTALHRTSLYRAKTFLLIVEAGALVLCLGRLARQGPPFDTSLALVSRLAVHIPLPLSDPTLFLVPALLLLVSRGTELLRRPEAPAPDRLLPWRYLLLTQAAILIGLQQGTLLLAGRELDLALSLLWVGFVGSLSAWAISMPFHLKSRPRADPMSNMPWVSLLLSMGLAGSLIVEDDGLAPGILKLLELCAWLSPAWALAAGLAWGESLIEPLRLRDLLSHRIPARARLLAAGLLLTSALPFGGLATPLWGVLQSRLPDAPGHAGKN